ncbi:hypothetical protein TNCV_4786321 [Trichonephila clavipes]|nr:hypothetical protein TNCV_4786321 [Trichonephila clavipes]
MLPLTPTHRRLRLEVLEKTGLQWNGTRPALATNPDSISAVMTIVSVWKPDGERLNPAFAFTATHNPQLVMMLRLPLPTIHGQP